MDQLNEEAGQPEWRDVALRPRAEVDSCFHHARQQDKVAKESVREKESVQANVKERLGRDHFGNET